VSSTLSPSATDTPFYPLLLNLAGKECLVVGGGKVAVRKARMLLRFGASVRVVSPAATRTLVKWNEEGKIVMRVGEYDEEDLRGTALVFAATDQEDVNVRIKKDAGSRNIPVNVVDNPRLCDFIVPSLVTKGPISIAISTSGTLPSLSKRLRKLIDREITGDYVKYARILGKVRRLLIDTEKDGRKRKTIMKRLGEMDMKEVNRLGFRKIKRTFLSPQE
jgi:precorrin-2 dehydrogenase / sirohydrochlorin ferrochelatase